MYHFLIHYLNHFTVFGQKKYAFNNMKKFKFTFGITF